MSKGTANPFDVSQSGDTVDARIGREGQGKSLTGNRARRRTSRPEQVAFKTTKLKIQQLDRLSVRANKTKVEVFEAALDALERELNDELKAKRA
jgi:hypothetical protein